MLLSLAITLLQSVMSRSMNIFPTQWKDAQITPISKMVQSFVQSLDIRTQSGEQTTNSGSYLDAAQWMQSQSQS